MAPHFPLHFRRPSSEPQRRMEDFYSAVPGPQHELQTGTPVPVNHRRPIAVMNSSVSNKRPRTSANAAADFFTPRSSKGSLRELLTAKEEEVDEKDELKRAIAASLAAAAVNTSRTLGSTANTDDSQHSSNAEIVVSSSEPVSGASSTASERGEEEEDLTEVTVLSQPNTSSSTEESPQHSTRDPEQRRRPVKTVWERSMGSKGVVLKTTEPYEARRPRSPSPPPVDKDKVQTRVRTGTLKRKVYSPNKPPEIKRSSVMPDGRVVALVKRDGGKLYSFKEFQRMWDDVFEDFGCDVEEIEEGSMVTRGNNGVQPSDTQGQSKAQYGRLLPNATDDLLQELKVCRHDVFVDIGHGIGNTVLQAAYTRGCEAHGIEVMVGRNEVAWLIRDNLASQRQIHLDRDERRTEVGKVRLRRGRLEVDEHRDFLTNPGKVTKGFLDNFNGVFSHRSLKARQVYTLDQFNAGLFCLMEPGSILVTLWPLDLGATLGEANDLRKKHGFSKKHTDKASFYTMEKFSFGEAREVVTWSQGGGCKQEMIGYKYTRIEQNTDQAVFQCCNASCPVARAGTCIPAAKYIDSPDETDILNQKRVILNSCECKYTPATKRTRRPKQHYYEG